MVTSRSLYSLRGRELANGVMGCRILVGSEVTEPVSARPLAKSSVTMINTR